MNCSVCNSKSNKIFKSLILNKYDVQYYQCPVCGFIQTESPYWLDEAYNEALVDFDTGVMVRNIDNVICVSEIIDKFYNKEAEQYLDYGGGYGIFTRMMRDVGYNFFWYDKYAIPLLARGFEYNGETIALLTNFEVFEHYVDPLDEINKLLKVSKDIIFSTQIYDKGLNFPKQDWWYYAQSGGQHISFYSEITLEYIANIFHLNYYNIFGLHWFTSKRIDKKKIRIISRSSFKRYYTKKWIRKMDYKNAVADMNLLIERK